MLLLRRLLSPAVTFCFITIFIAQSFPVYAAKESLLNLPEPGKMVSLSSKFVPAYVKGISIYPNDPFKFDFIIDTGNSKFNDQQFKEESNKLIKYFMAALTVPAKEDWVNLSPYEKDRIIPESLGVTDMGRDMLAQDYILKQLTSSLIYPEKAIGKEFWSKVYAQAQQQFGTTNIPVNTFNKVWIVPSQAVVWEHDNSAYVVRSHLKVMLQQDYLSLNKHLNNNIFSGSSMDQRDAKATNAVGSNVVREIVLPALEKEVNEGANFAALRQVFNSAILAAWYKQNLKQTILGQVYANKNKVLGVDLADKQIKQKIYQRYLQAYKKGVYNFIKEDNDPVTNQPIARKYFSGGESLDVTGVEVTEGGDFATLAREDQADLVQASGSINKVTVQVVGAGAATRDQAMLPGASGFETVQSLPGFANALQAQKLSPEKVEIAALKLNPGADVAGVLSDVGAQEAVSTAIKQALGSIPFAGRGTKAKEVADGNAVHMGEQALVDSVKRDKKIAYVSVGSEGVRDGSIGTPLGRVFWSGYGEEQGYKYDTQQEGKPVDNVVYENEIIRLRHLGVQIIYFYDDALENTNALKDNEKDAWSLTAFEYDNPTKPPRHLLDEVDLRRVSVVAHTPFYIRFEATDSPKQILQKLATGFQVNLYSEDGKTPSEEGKAFAKRIKFALLGARKAANVKASTNNRHQFYFDGIKDLQNQGFPVTNMEFGDGDLMPGIVAASGIELDDQKTIVVKVGRSGLVEAEVMDIAASMFPHARLASRVVSDETTRASVTPTTIPTVQEGLLDKLVGEYGYTKDTFTNERNNGTGGKRIVAMTAVTGADAARYYQGFANMLPGVIFDDNNNTVTVSTLLVTRQGMFVVRSTLKARNGIDASKRAILNASKEAQEYVRENKNTFNFVTADKAMQVTQEAKSVPELLSNIAGAVKVNAGGGVEILDINALRGQTIDYLVQEATLNDNQDVKKSAQQIIRETANALGIKPASMDAFYRKRNKPDGWKKLTVGAYNIRTGPAYLTMQQIVKASMEDKVGPFILELATSERRYTGQLYHEFTANGFAAAIKQGYSGPIFFQLDHLQIPAADFAKDPVAALKKAKELIEEAFAAGIYHIDIDPSTLFKDKVLEEILKIERQITTEYIQKRIADGDKDFEAKISALGGIQEEVGKESAGIRDIRRALVNFLEVGQEIPDYYERMLAKKAELVRDGILDENAGLERGVLTQADVQSLRQHPLDAQVLADLKAKYADMHEVTIQVTMELIRFIRKEMEPKYGLTFPSLIGVEERHVDNKLHKDYPSTVLGSLTLMRAVNKQCADEKMVTPAKEALQTGTQHGLGGEPYWGSYIQHEIAAEEIGVHVFVQHGTSTLKESEFPNMPVMGTGEAHLATKNQQLALGIIGDRSPELRQAFQNYLMALINTKLTETEVNTVTLAKLKEAGLWNKREDYEKKYQFIWNAVFAKLQGLGWDDAKIMIGLLYDNIPTDLTFTNEKGKAEKIRGSLKDLIKELSGPFKREIWLLEQDVHRDIAKAVYDETKRINRDLNAGNSQEMLQRIMPFENYVAPSFKRTEALQRAVDAAQISKVDRALVVKKTPEGGINLDASLYNMQVLRDGNGAILPISQQPIGRFMKIKGFKPVLLNIEHNINLPARLGGNLDKFSQDRLTKVSSVVSKEAVF